MASLIEESTENSLVSAQIGIGVIFGINLAALTSATDIYVLVGHRIRINVVRINLAAGALAINEDMLMRCGLGIGKVVGIGLTALTNALNENVLMGVGIISGIEKLHSLGIGNPAVIKVVVDNSVCDWTGKIGSLCPVIIVVKNKVGTGICGLRLVKSVLAERKPVAGPIALLGIRFHIPVVNGYLIPLCPVQKENVEYIGIRFWLGLGFRLRLRLWFRIGLVACVTPSAGNVIRKLLFLVSLITVINVAATDYIGINLATACGNGKQHEKYKNKAYDLFHIYTLSHFIPI